MSLIDAGRLLSDLHYAYSVSRRCVIVSFKHINKDYAGTLAEAPVGSELFSHNLINCLLSDKQLEETSKILKPPAPEKPAPKPSAYQQGTFKLSASSPEEIIRPISGWTQHVPRRIVSLKPITSNHAVLASRQNPSLISPDRAFGELLSQVQQILVH